MKYEFILWYTWLIGSIPGQLGCIVRRYFLPSSIGKKSTVWNRVQIDYPKKLVIGNNTSINRGAILNCGGRILIGNDVLIGPNVTIYSQNHCYKKAGEVIRNQGYSYSSVTIKDDVWIAAGVIILPGVTIHEGAVVGAGSVVTKDVAPYTVVAGNPAREISVRI